jgi:hypothetical protein
MTEHIQFSEVYDASPHDMFRMVTRLDHLEEKAAALGHRGHRMLELRERDGLFRSVTQRDVDVDLPRWAPGFIYPRNTIIQTQLWHPPTYDGSRRYEAYIEVTRVPVTVVGEGVLTGLNYTSTRYDIQLDVRSTFPLVGRKIEKFVAAQFEEAIRDEHEFRLLWMGRRGRQQHHSAWT